jgi:outer membrane protein assembly factor BamB
VYFGVANPAPFPGVAAYPNGTSRPGPNLYTDSIVALRVDTGKLVWYHQVTPHDIFDRDQVHALLAHLPDGREVVLSAGKSGVVVALDPATGRELWQRKIGKHQNDTLSALRGPTEIAPGTYGGVLTPPAAQGDDAYFAVVNEPTVLKPAETAYFGAPMGEHPGDLVALDVATGRVRWSVPVPGDPLGGATVVNDLVLTATLQGTVVAYDRADGHERWRYQAPGGLNGWLSAVDDTLYIPVGNAQPSTIVALRLD